MGRLPGSDRDKTGRAADEWRPCSRDGNGSSSMLRTAVSSSVEQGVGIKVGARTTTSAIKKRSIGIVGAGISGLRCADILLRQGYKVIIFEGRDRVGGRVAQSDQLGTRVDLGPNWIHGTEGNPIHKLAAKTGTRLHDWDLQTRVYGVDGKSLPDDEAAEYGRQIWADGLISKAFEFSEEKKTSIPASQSLYDFFETQAQDLYHDLPPEEAKRKRATLLEVCRMWGAYVGSPVEQQSLRYIWLEECIEGENLFVAETYHKIMQEIARTATEHDCVKLNTRVTKIGYRNADGRGEQQRSHVSLTTSDGEQHFFDHVVVTAPLGWLKRNQSCFEPKLPPRLGQAIDGIGYGCLDKVYFTFPEPFWQASAGGDTAIKGETNGESREKERGHHPSFTHWLSPSYDPAQNPDGWDLQAMNLASLPDPHAHATLLFYIQGPCSQHIASLVQSCDDPSTLSTSRSSSSSSSSSRMELQAKLTAWFKPYLSLLPNYHAEDPRCAPSQVLATAWANDELAGYGSYCNFQVGLEEGDKDVVTIRRGLPESGLWFAGEHTAPFVALGTTTGAYWSGEAVAWRIIDGGIGGGGGDDAS